MKYLKNNQVNYLAFKSGGAMPFDVGSLLATVGGGLVPQSEEAAKLNTGTSQGVNAFADQAISAVNPLLGAAFTVGRNATSNLKDVECIPDPDSPTGETCFDKTTGLKAVGSNALDVGAKVEGLMDSSKQFMKGNFKEGATGLIDNATFGFTNFNKQDEEKQKKLELENQLRKQYELEKVGQSQRLARKQNEMNMTKNKYSPFGVSTAYAKQGGKFHFKKGGDIPCNQPKASTSKGKKKMVKACKDGKEKLIHFGAKGYGHNYSDAARKSFKARHNCDTANDKMTARYWSCKHLWAGKGGSTKSSPSSKKGKYQEGGGINSPMLKGAERHLSAVERSMYKKAFELNDKKTISYLESKINKGLRKDSMLKNQEIERYAELQGRDSRDGTSMVDAQANKDSWRKHVPLYNTLSGNSPKLAYSDIREGVIGNPDDSKKNFVSGALGAIEPILDIVDILATFETGGGSLLAGGGKKKIINKILTSVSKKEKTDLYKELLDITKDKKLASEIEKTVKGEKFKNYFGDWEKGDIKIDRYNEVVEIVDNFGEDFVISGSPAINAQGVLKRDYYNEPVHDLDFNVFAGKLKPKRYGEDKFEDTFTPLELQSTKLEDVKKEQWYKKVKDVYPDLEIKESNYVNYNKPSKTATKTFMAELPTKNLGKLHLDFFHSPHPIDISKSSNRSFRTAEDVLAIKQDPMFSRPKDLKDVKGFVPYNESNFIEEGKQKALSPFFQFGLITNKDKTPKVFMVDEKPYFKNYAGEYKSIFSKEFKTKSLNTKHQLGGNIK